MLRWRSIASFIIDKRDAFTTVELIFVIVIIGILAAVAIPKYHETATNAHNTKVETFIHTLNASVAPAIWNKSLNEGHNGQVGSANMCNDMSRYVNLPSEVSSIDSTCSIHLLSTSGTSYTDADISFQEGNATRPPRWILR